MLFRSKLEILQIPTMHQLITQRIKRRKHPTTPRTTLIGDMLLEAIRTLPEEKRKAVLLYYFEGMNDTEIAELFDTSRSTIQYRRTSSFELLKKYLEENADEWDEW